MKCLPTTAFAIGSLMILPAMAQTTADQSTQAQEIRSALQSLQSRYQAATGQSMFTGNGYGQSLQNTANGAANAVGRVENTVRDGAADASKISDKAKATASTEPESYGGPTDKIPIGYVAEGQLDMSPNSDYPGPWWGHLTQPIYSIDRTKILFPEGTKITGRTVRITGTNEVINNRIGLAPQFFTLRDGHSFKISHQDILDQLGIAGIPGEVDYHLATELAAIGAFAAVDSLPNILQAQAGASPSVQGTFFQQTSNHGDAILQKYIGLVPTVQPKVGDPIRIFFGEEMLAAPVAHPVDRFQLTNIKDTTSISSADRKE